ncbi:MAG: hypothetical protein ACLUFN_07520 [Eubacterium sp.]
MWLEYWGYMLGIPYEDFSCMPLSKLFDLISIYQIANGIADEIFDDNYFPNLR